jgi:streptogramin lyase
MRRPLLFVFLAIGAVLAACTSHSIPGLVPALPQYEQAAGTVTKVTVKITIATKGAATRSDARLPRYFSASSKGLLVQAFAHGKTKVLAQTAVDISPGSTACGKKKTTPRTCSATLMVAPSKGDDFAVLDYSAKPKSGKIPKSAKLLGYGKLTNKKVSATKTNSFSVYLGGVIAGLSGNAGFVSVPGDGKSHTVALVIDPTDFGNNPITAGKKDPFANPISVAITEAGGSGHALLSLNGGSGAPNVTLTQSTDTVEVQYDGGGSAGYGITVTLSAKNVAKAGGATEAVTISPLFASASFASTSMVSAGTLTLSPGLQPSVTFSELNAPSTQTYAAALQGTCFDIATLGETTTTTAIVTGGTMFSATGCTLSITDSMSTTANLTVANQALTAHVAAPSTVTISEYPLPAGTPGPRGITAGSDGALWFVEFSGNKVGRIPTNATVGSSAQISEYPIPTASPSKPVDIAAGTDGALWFSTCAGGSVNGKISRIPTNATPGSGAQITSFPAPPNFDPYGLGFAPNGTIWYGDWNNNSVGNMTPAGVATHQPTASSYTDGFVVGPDGNMWFTECQGPSYIAKVTPAGNLSEALIPYGAAPVPSPTVSPEAYFITVGSDGNLWYSDDSSNAAIGKATLSAGTISSFKEFRLPNPGAASPVKLVPGPDGALWFADGGNNAIGRIPTDVTVASSITEYPMPTSSAAPWGIAEGPDGALWVTETSGEKIARVSFAASAAGKRVPRITHFLTTGHHRLGRHLHRHRSASPQ